MIKILAIGNSFSQDATAYIERLADKIFVRNLFIGGCELARHADLLKNGNKEYEYQKDGENILPYLVSVEDALKFEDWDYITIQQASGVSGILDSYYPYVKELISFVKERSNAEIVFHQTWAYEKDSTHRFFVNYNNDYAKMWNDIRFATNRVCKDENLRMIPSGEIIAKLREIPYFDVYKGGKTLCRDGFHMSLEYGRYAVACVWIKFFTGEIPDFIKNNLDEGFKHIYFILNEIMNYELY